MRNTVNKPIPLAGTSLGKGRNRTNVETRFIVSNRKDVINHISTKRKSAFTLVELIIVITILAILATIGFMSFQTYTIDARDANRITSLKTMSDGLQIYQAKKSTLPDPDAQTVSIMSGGLLISTQGYAGTSVLQKLKASDIKDPSDNNYYTYIVNSDKTKYQLLGMLEKDTNLVAYSPLPLGEGLGVRAVHARTDYTSRYAYTTGNKVGIFFSGTTNTPIQETISGSLVLTDATNSTKIFKVMFSNSKTNSGTLSITGTNLPAIIQTETNTTATTQTVVTNPTCTSGQGLNTSGQCVTATSCSSTLTEITLANGQTWSCKNLGATTVWDGTTQPTNCGNVSTTNCNSSLTFLGDYYQWGRNDTGFTIGQRASPYLYGWEAQNDTKWGGSSSDTATADGAGTTKEGRQGPCPTGRHVPSAKDFQDMCNSVTNSTCTNGMAYNANIQSVLKIPFAGHRYRGTGYYVNQSVNAFYWSSSPSTSSAFVLYFNASTIYPTYNLYRATAFSLRCLKN